MSEANSDIHTLTRPRNHHGTTDRANIRRRRPPTSEQQRQKLSEAQKAYVATDPRWAVHRQKLADAQTARRMTLSPEELEMVPSRRWWKLGLTPPPLGKDIGSSREVNAFGAERFGERLPAVDLAHVDLA